MVRITHEYVRTVCMPSNCRVLHSQRLGKTTSGGTESFHDENTFLSFFSLLSFPSFRPCLSHAGDFTYTRASAEQIEMSEAVPFLTHRSRCAVRFTGNSCFSVSPATSLCAVFLCFLQLALSHQALRHSRALPASPSPLRDPHLRLH